MVILIANRQTFEEQRFVTRDAVGVTQAGFCSSFAFLRRLYLWFPCVYWHLPSRSLRCLLSRFVASFSQSLRFLFLA
jgi:hypothetical protein